MTAIYRYMYYCHLIMQDDDGDQPIHEAAKSANIDVLQHLIVKYKVDPRTPGKVLLQLQLY